jgi:acyl-CoA thioesterase-2
MTTDRAEGVGDVEDLPPTVERLLWLLDLERLDRDLFRGRSPAHRHNGRLFGGQVAAQALRAATLTVDSDHHPHSLHGYFLRPGLTGRRLILHVDRIRDGRSFTTRRVVAVQDGEAIFSLSASFHMDESGGTYQLPRAEDIPGPEDDHPWLESPVRVGASDSPFEVHEFRPADADERGVLSSTRRVWLRTRGPLPDDRALHACVLTYISDMGAVNAARRALRLPWGGMSASLDHAIWFHQPIRPDQWLLYDLRPLSNGGARGLVLGTMHDLAGVHGASVTQEALVREGPPA